MPTSVYVEKDIVPIFTVAEPAPVKPISFRGTGFLIAPNVLITCWHCIRQTLPDGRHYAVAVKEDDGYTAVFLRNAEQHPDGLDLAIAQVNLVPQLGLMLSPEVLQTGADIVTYGFPLTETIGTEGDSVRFQLNARFLQGYITRSFYYDHPGFGQTPSYELDMPAPEGLCGGPIIKVRTKEVAGVVFGSLDVARIEQFARVDVETGKRQLEIERVVSFGLAHYTESLWNLRGTATLGKPLCEFLELDIKGQASP